MNRWNAAVAIALAGALAACQSGAEKTKVESASPAPAANAASPAPGSYSMAPETPATAAAAPAEPVRQERPATTAGSARTSRAQGSRSATPGKTVRRPTSQHPVERIEQPIADEPLPRTGGERTARNEEQERAQEAERARLSLPAGTELRLVLETALASDTSQAGDAVTARVERAFGPDGDVVLPGGTVLKGRVYRAAAAGRVSGRSYLAVDFDRIVIRGTEHRLDTTAIEVQGPESHGRDAAIIGGSTAGGAIIGAILDGGKGAKKGAIVGAIGGTGAVLATRGKEIELPAGSKWTVTIKNAVTVR